MAVKEYDAVVFDMDGVIFDSERAVMNCWLELAKKYGIENIEEPYLACTGTNAARTREIMLEAYGADFPYDAYAKEASLLYHEKYDGGRLPMKPGVVELLNFLKKEKKHIALASSTRRHTVINQLRDAGILDFFDVVICGDMIERSKPAPDIFLKACEELGVQPSRSYAIEDSYNGIRAAHAGKLMPIMVPDLLPENAEMEKLSEVILETLLDVIDYLKEKRILLFDLDGTLLRDDKTLSQYTLEVISKCKEQGCLIGISTSRGEQNCLKFLKELKPDILISSGGALVRADEKIVCSSSFSAAETRSFIATARNICGADCEITVDTLDAHYWNYKTDPKEQDKSWGESIYTDFSDFEHEALKICVEIPGFGMARKLCEHFSELDSKRFSDGDWYKFTKSGITKEKAILAVCEAYRADVSEIIAFGDDYADIGMLKLCGTGVAMGNAIQEVKDIADAVTLSNEEDGVAAYLKKFLVDSGNIL